MDNYTWFKIFAALNGGLLTLLAFNVSRIRMSQHIPHGDGGSIPMKAAIRAHANGVEHVSIFGLMVLALSVPPAEGGILPTLVGAFTASRLIHAMGMLSKFFNLRRVGAGVTYTCEVVAAAYLLLSVMN